MRRPDFPAARGRRHPTPPLHQSIQVEEMEGSSRAPEEAPKRIPYIFGRQAAMVLCGRVSWSRP